MDIVKLKVEPEYATNEETGTKYELKPNKYKQYPHLDVLRDECLNVSFDSKKYWELRCKYLEKSLDPTYTVFERDNCFDFHRILASRYR